MRHDTVNSIHAAVATAETAFTEAVKVEAKASAEYGDERSKEFVNRDKLYQAERAHLASQRPLATARVTLDEARIRSSAASGPAAALLGRWDAAVRERIVAEELAVSKFEQLFDSAIRPLIIAAAAKCEAEQVAYNAILPTTRNVLSLPHPTNFWFALREAPVAEGSDFLGRILAARAWAERLADNSTTPNNAVLPGDPKNFNLRTFRDLLPNGKGGLRAENP